MKKARIQLFAVMGCTLSKMLNIFYGSIISFMIRKKTPTNRLAVLTTKGQTQNWLNKKLNKQQLD